ncbi:MAG: excinuclease ABC subunit UvrC [Phycisphaerae bacterium]|nr:excinuclease ABC subunit UvrC [Phycisphaerae bacterium]
MKTFPQGPGLYFIKDSRDTVLYIGKAKNLRNRIASYFQRGADLMGSRGPKIVEMVAQATAVDYLECASEVDAILQEARLIKDIRPAYNTELMDDKTFPYLEVTTGDDFPGLYVTRTPRSKGSRLFGPFTNSRDLRAAIVVLQKIFKFRTCHLDIQASDKNRRFFRPCLLYSIHQCTAPCAAKIDKAEYKKLISDVIRFLRSKRSTVLRQLEKKMQEASAAMAYEKAAVYRDRIHLIRRLDERGTPDDHVQPEVFAADPTEALEALRKALHLDHDIRTIEGMDIAHLQGNQSVGSLVKFIDGRPFKSGYRRFRIKTVAHIDDYASIAEVVRRRYKYALRGEELWPDLILIDGGLGQLHAAEKAMIDLLAGAVSVQETSAFPQNTTLISLAKKEELIYKQGAKDPIRLSAHSPARKLLQYIRDESHRFAQHYHHLLRSKDMLD